jgi:2-octaprenyl-6-methoxyphenol hydroxylase
LRHLRIVDATDRLLRAPEVLFHASEIGLDAFGYNIENTRLVGALREQAARAENLTLFDESAAAIRHDGDRVIVDLANGGSVSAALLVGADGRNSMSRKATGISVSERLYPQAALTLNLRHSRSHGEASTEFHTRNGPMTLVPLPGQRASLVLVTTPDEAEWLSKLDDAALGHELTQRTHWLLGTITPDGRRGVRPLGMMRAGRLTRKRVALVGEAGHVLPPIGAQGLNLGIRDAVAIAAVASAALRQGRDPGADEVLAAYEKDRRGDVHSRAFAVDALNRSLLSDLLPAQAARSAGLWLLSCFGPLRREVMRQGMAMDTRREQEHRTVAH